MSWPRSRVSPTCLRCCRVRVPRAALTARAHTANLLVASARGHPCSCQAYFRARFAQRGLLVPSKCRQAAHTYHSLLPHNPLYLPPPAPRAALNAANLTQSLSLPTFNGTVIAPQDSVSRLSPSCALTPLRSPSACST